MWFDRHKTYSQADPVVLPKEPVYVRAGPLVRPERPVREGHSDIPGHGVLGAGEQVTN